MIASSALRTPYARWLVRRSLAAELVLFVVAFAISAVTDEGGVPFPVRLGRALPLVPLTAALATLGVVLGARGRGEERALGALGFAPARIALVCALAATTLPLLAAAAIGSGRVDVDGFFPAPPSAPAFRDVGASFVSEELGIRVRPDGELEPLSRLPSSKEVKSTPPRALPAHAHGAAAATTLLASAALALSAGRGRARQRIRALLPAGLTTVATLLLFQLAAAGRVAAPFTAAPALALLVFEIFAYRSER